MNGFDNLGFHKITRILYDEGGYDFKGVNCYGEKRSAVKKENLQK